MARRVIGTAIALAICLSCVFVHAQQRGKPGEKPKGEKPKNEKPEGEKPKGEKPENENRGGSKPPGGAWSEPKKSSGNPAREPGAPGKENQPQEAAEKNKLKPNEASGAEGAGAAAAAENRNKPPASGAQGAAAGAAAANRNQPPASGAAGAAAGATAANRNQPKASGAEGVTAGAAAANRNQPKATGAEGVAAGAAAANRNQPAATGAQGAAIGVAAANRNQPATASVGAAAVRSSFDHPNVYGTQWYSEHTNAWAPTTWASGAAWTAASFATVATHCGYGNGTPVSYGYGSNVNYQDGNVILNGQNVGTAEEFSQKAADLALLGQNSKAASGDEWLPLGVFALVRDEDHHPQLTIQLAINKQGILRGNYTDLVSDNTLPIHGAVDSDTQRAAWTVGNNKNFFMEAGLSNLTTGEAPALIHKFSRTERWLLVRLDQDKQTGDSSDSSK